MSLPPDPALMLLMMCSLPRSRSSPVAGGLDE